MSFLRHFNEYIRSIIVNIKLNVSAYRFTYLFEGFQCNVWRKMKQMATFQYVKIGEFL